MKTKLCDKSWVGEESILELCALPLLLNTRKVKIVKFHLERFER